MYEYAAGEIEIYARSSSEWSMATRSTSALTAAWTWHTTSRYIRQGSTSPELTTLEGKTAKIWCNPQWFQTHCPNNQFTVCRLLRIREKNTVDIWRLLLRTRWC